jgi:hypothetical protein
MMGFLVLDLKGGALAPILIVFKKIMGTFGSFLRSIFNKLVCSISAHISK